jgi:hypothetical protein
MAEKEEHIVDIKKKQQEMEKFKFVLNYKIQELKRKVLPRKRDIADLCSTLKEMETELLSYHKSSAALELMVGELRLKRDGLAKEEGSRRSELAVRSEQLACIQRDMDSLQSIASAAAGSKEAGDAKKVRSLLVQLYKKYIHGEASSGSASGSLDVRLAKDGHTVLFPLGAAAEEVAGSVERSRSRLERAVAALSLKAAAAASSSAEGAKRLLRENTALLAELNDKRRELRYTLAELAKARGGSADAGAAPPSPLSLSAPVSAPALAPASSPAPAAVLSSSTGRRTAALGGLVGSAGTKGSAAAAAAAAGLAAHSASSGRPIPASPARSLRLGAAGSSSPAKPASSGAAAQLAVGATALQGGRA